MDESLFLFQLDLSPFLFLIVAEGLSRLVWKLIESQCLLGFRVSNPLSILPSYSLRMTLYFFCYGKECNLWCLKEILRSFKMVLGLMVNFGKSNVVGINIEERA